MKHAFYLLLAVTLGCATTRDAPAPPPDHTISLAKDVHFMLLEGDPVQVGAGDYTLLDEGDGRLRLRAAHTGEIVLPTTATTHRTSGLETPRAVSASAGEDEHRVALEFPWGVALEARGTYSGARRIRDEVRLRGSSLGPVEDVPGIRYLTIVGTALAADSKVLRRRSQWSDFPEVMNLALRSAPNEAPSHVYMYAPVHLPQGAVLRDIRFYYEDNDPYADAAACLVGVNREFPPEVNPLLMRGRRDGRRDPDTTIDNTQYAYRIEVRLPARWVPPDIDPRIADFVDTPDRYHYEARLRLIRIAYTVDAESADGHTLAVDGAALCCEESFLRRKREQWSIEPAELTETLNPDLRRDQDATPTTCRFYAPVQLPNGATVLAAEFRGYAGGNRVDMSGGLYRKALNLTGRGSGWVARFNDDREFPPVALEPSKARIDHSKYAYAFEVTVPDRWISPDIPPLEADNIDNPERTSWYWEARPLAFRITYTVPPVTSTRRFAAAGGDFRCDEPFARVNRTEAANPAKRRARRIVFGSEPLLMQLPLELPLGASINEVIVHYRDTDSLADLEVVLMASRETDSKGPDVAIVAALARSQGSAGRGTVRASLFPNGRTRGDMTVPVRNDGKWAYWFEARLPTGYGDAKTHLVAVEVGYTVLGQVAPQAAPG